MTSLHDDPWIRRFHSAGDGAPRLVWLPHAGGSASSCFPLSQALSPGLEVLAVQYPGRQDRFAEPCVDDVQALADEIFRRLRDRADRTLALFGHSMGATVAYEVALRLEGAGLSVTHLFVSAARGPACERRERVHLMDDDGLVAEMRRLGGTDEALLADPDLMSMVLGTVRSDYRAIETYRHSGGVLRCPVTALVGDADPGTPVDAARTWGDHTRGAFDLRVFTGGHFYVDDHVGGVAQVVSTTLTPSRSPA